MAENECGQSAVETGKSTSHDPRGSYGGEYVQRGEEVRAVRRFGKLKYETLRVPSTVVAREADRSVKFGEGGGSAYLFDPDIYTDGRISVQGIDSVLFPTEEEVIPVTTVGPTAAKKVPTPPRMIRERSVNL